MNFSVQRAWRSLWDSLDGLSCQSCGILQHITLEFNVYNLLNRSYIATVGEQGNPISGDYQSMLIGAPRQFFGTVRAEF